MAKLALLLATFAVVFLVVNASIYRITVDSDNDRQESCQQQIRRLHNLQQCQRYMEEKSRGGRYNRSSRELDVCCEQLEELDEKCRCQGLQQAVRQQIQGVEREEREDMYEVAERIVNHCEVLEPRRCDIRSRSWF